MVIHLFFEEPKSACSGFFSPIERNISLAHERLRIGSIDWRQRDPDARPKHMLSGIDRHRTLQGFDDPESQRRGSLRTGKMGGQHRKLIPSQSPNHIAVPNRPAQSACDLDQRLITGGMAIEIVDAFEAVQVHHQNRVDGVRPRRGGNSGFQSLIKLASIGEARQGVFHRKRTSFLFGRPPAAYLTSLCPKPGPGKQSKAQRADSENLVEFKDKLSVRFGFVGEDVVLPHAKRDRGHAVWSLTSSASKCPSHIRWQ